MMKQFIRKMSYLNKYSQVITQHQESCSAQSMLYALELDKLDLKKPQVGIGTVWLEGNTCNSQLTQLSDKIKVSVEEQNLLSMIFYTIGVSDSISMRTSSISYSLPSSEHIADSFESVVRGQHYDSLICLSGCDKNLPASAMALARLNRPGFIIYGGSIKPSIYNGNTLDIVSSFESYEEINEEERLGIVQNSCNTDCGSCSEFYTANTMACLLEVMGLTLPNSSSNMSLSKEKFQECDDAGLVIKNLLKYNIKPLDIMTHESFLNAVKFLYLIGGSTNGVIHLLAMAKTANVELTLDDFQKFQHLPVLTNMKPHGEYVMNDLNKIGGTQYLIKYLIDNGIINGNCMTVTGLKLKDNLCHLETDILTNNFKITDKKIIHSLENPYKTSSHINILSGNLAPSGCISKIYSDKKKYQGTAKVYNTEKEMLFALKNGQISSNDFVILRYQGESIGCPEMLTPTSALVGYFGDNTPPLATDGRFSGGSCGILVAHLPDAYKENSVTALIENNDLISIDLYENKIHLNVSQEELNKRSLNVRKPELKLDGYLSKFSKLVSDLDSGYLN